MAKPRYFIAVFGDPQPGKDAVESGVYTPDPKYSVSVSPGDVMLLYCTSSYSTHRLEAPGIGVALRVGRKHIEYRWIPFARSIAKADIDTNLDPDDAAKMRNIRFASYWLFEVSAQSFAKTLDSRAIAWGNL